MLFDQLCEAFDQIGVTPKRLEKMRLLAEILWECGEGEVKQVVYLALGELRPKYEKLEFNMAEKMVARAVAGAAGKKTGEVELEYKKVGDLGEVAENAKRKTQNAKLTIVEVYEALVMIAADGGPGSQERKVQSLAKLLAGAGGRGAKYIVRVVLSKLRLGFSDKTILDTLSYIDKGDKSAREVLDRLYQVAPDVGELAFQVKRVGTQRAGGAIKVELGRPVIPALAQRLSTADEMIKKMGKVILEPKYDGTRVAIHFSRKGANNQAPNFDKQAGLFGEERSKFWVRTFTRNLDENSAMFPELATIGELITAEEVILDAEAVGYDPQTGRLASFQLTMTRKRKHGIKAASGAVPLKFFVFDILYKDGASLLERPLWERKKILAKTVVGRGVLEVDAYQVTEEASQLRTYHRAKLAEGLEGAMVKKYDGKYTPGRQGFNWVKLKEEEGTKGKLLDTIDAVVMGYYRGKGKRTGFGLGAFLIGIRGGEGIKTVAKVGTGLSDELFRELYERLRGVEIREMDTRYEVGKALAPDVWVAPELVIEVAADEVTKSPMHSSGYALRFPRLVKLREDKDLSGVTTTAELKEIAGIV